MIFSCAHEGCGERQDVVESVYQDGAASIHVTAESWPEEASGMVTPSVRAWEATDQNTGVTCTVRWRCPAHRNPVPWMPLPI